MPRRGIAWVIVALLAATLMAAAAVPSAKAAEQRVTLIAFNTDWHLGSSSAPRNPTITVIAGDSLNLTIQNADGIVDHTFTVTHFGKDQPLAGGATIFVNISTSTADIGTWQFYCSIIGHAPLSGGSRTGMVGSIVVTSGTAPPPPSGIDPLVIVIILVVVVVIGAAAVGLMRRKKPA